MSVYDQSASSRQRGGNHRPRYYDEDSDGGYAPPPRPRNRDGQTPRGPLGPNPVRDDYISPPPFGMPPPHAFAAAVPPPPMSMSAPAQPQQQPAQTHPSILIDPEETSSQRERRRFSRSRSNVRLQVSSADDDSDYDDRARRGHSTRHGLRRRRSLDLEQKTSNENRQFRSKRDDYESDEGETHRRSKQSSRFDRKPRRRDYHDDDYEDSHSLERSKSLKDKMIDKFSLPLRGRPRGLDNSVFEYGAAPVAAEAVEGPARPRLRGYDTEPEMPRRRNPVDQYDGNARGHRQTDYYDDGRATRPSKRHSSTFDDRGYRSDGRSRRSKYEDYDDDEDDRYRRRNDRYRSGGERSGNSLRPPRGTQDPYYSDSRDDRGSRRDRDRRDRDRYRDDRAYKRDPYARDRYDDYYDRGDRSRGTKRDSSWQKEASAAFMAYAMPYIKKEGPRLVQRELQKFMEKRKGGG